MKMSVLAEGGRSLQMKIEHEDQLLLFDLSSYNKNYLIGGYDVCEHINAYFASLPIQKQEVIFNTMSQIRETFEELSDTSSLCIKLIPMIHRLYEELNLEDIERWMVYHTTIRIPAKFDENYVHSDERPFSRDKTYTRPDYTKLVALTLALRVMVPIWGEFILRTRVETGTSFKEYYAYSLLAQTRINECAAIEKLKVYIRANIQAEKSMSSVIVSGVGSEDYGPWVLSSLLVKRLCVGDVRGNEINTNLVVTIHNDLTAKNNGSSGSSFGDPIQNKIFEGDGDESQGPSRIENFKIKSEFPIGDIASIEHYSSDYRRVGTDLMPEMDMVLLEEFVGAAKALLSQPISSYQTNLMQWVLAPVIPPRSMAHLDKITNVNLMAVAQTYLWQKDHKKLACLLTALSDNEGIDFQQNGIGSMARITREQMDELQVLFPYSKVSVKKKVTTAINSAVAAIDALAVGFNASDWVLTAPSRFVEEIVGAKHLRRYSCPHDIKIILAKLAIEVSKRS